MNGNELLDALPENPGEEYNKMILKAAENGLLKTDWLGITSTIDNDTAIFYVCSDALYIEINENTKERFRPQCTPNIQQKVADIFEASLPTTKIMDLRHQQANLVLDATVFKADLKMATKTRSKEYNKKLELKRNGNEGICSDIGKSWILHEKLNQCKNGGGINYGFYHKSGSYKTPLGQKAYQMPAAAHGTYGHQDYSQIFLLLLNQCALNGQTVNIIDLMNDPKLSYLLNYSGIIKYTRQPGV